MHMEYWLRKRIKNAALMDRIKALRKKEVLW